MKQFGWYALQSAVVLGVFAFYVEIINKENPDDPVPLHAAFLMGVLLAILVTGLLSAFFRLVRKLLPKRQGGVGEHRR